MPKSPDPIADFVTRFMDDFVFPRLEEAFDGIAETMRKPAQSPRPPRLPKQSPHKPKRAHKAPTSGQTRHPWPNRIYTYYHLFEVSPTASAEVLAAAHKVLVKRYHPDGVRGAAEKTAREVKIKIVNTAWEVLGDPAKRREYDRAIGVR